MNELIPNTTWMQRNKMRLYAILFVLFCVSVVFVISGGTENASNYMEVYSHSEVYQNAVAESNKNPRVIEIFGTLEPIDNLAIAEGNALYSNDGKTFEMTARVQGDKGKAKIQILAEKTNGIWKYKTITIKSKNPEVEVSIIKQ